MKGDDLWVDHFSGAFYSQGARNVRMDVALVDDHDRTFLVLEGDTRNTEYAVAAMKPYSIEVNGNLPPETQLVCGRLHVRDVHVATVCHRISRGWRFW